MTDLNTTLPPALRGALELLADPPAKPEVSNGYLDLLGAGLPTARRGRHTNRCAGEGRAWPNVKAVNA